MGKPVLVLGYGPIGKAIAKLLVSQTYPVIVAQRRRPADLALDIPFRQCDVLEAGSVTDACRNASQVVVAIGFAYRSNVWKRDWPMAMNNILAACRESCSRMLFIDNLYMYGPQSEVLHENMPLTDFGVKPRVRAEITRYWQNAASAGHVRVAALRAPDFYGPGVHVSHLGTDSIGAIAQGKSGRMLMSPHLPHDFAYVPDIARAAVTLLEAPDACFGQAWHVPVAPTRTPREIIEIASSIAGHPAKIANMSPGAIKFLSIFIPALHEFVEMQFLLNRSYRVDASKFSRRFWTEATTFEEGIAATLAYYQQPGHRV